MNNGTIERIRSDLDEATSALRTERDGDEFIRRLDMLISRLELGKADLVCEVAPGVLTTEEQLHLRAIKDYVALQNSLSRVREALGNRNVFVQTLQRKCHDVDSMAWHVEVLAAMHQVLQHLMHLMQYDTLDRVKVDIANGFRFSSGSMHYSQTLFAPSNKNSGK